MLVWIQALQCSEDVRRQTTQKVIVCTKSLPVLQNSENWSSEGTKGKEATWVFSLKLKRSWLRIKNYLAIPSLLPFSKLLPITYNSHIHYSKIGTLIVAAAYFYFLSFPPTLPPHLALWVETIFLCFFFLLAPKKASNSFHFRNKKVNLIKLRGLTV